MLPAAVQAVEVEKGLLDCLDQSDAEQRLLCYDRLAVQVRISEVTPSTLNPTNPSAGMSTSASISSRIAKVSNTARGHRAFVLENGQTWIEVEVGRQRIKAGQTVTVNKRRWRHVMQLEGMPDIGVRPAD